METLTLNVSEIETVDITDEYGRGIMKSNIMVRLEVEEKTLRVIITPRKK